MRALRHAPELGATKRQLSLIGLIVADMQDRGYTIAVASLVDANDNWEPLRLF